MSPDTEQLSISYMSSHPQLYKQLANSSENIAKMKKIEQSLSGKEVHYLPKAKLPADGLPWIKDGDIIAITTNTPGLDVATWESLSMQMANSCWYTLLLPTRKWLFPKSPCPKC